MSAQTSGNVKKRTIQIAIAVIVVAALVLGIRSATHSDTEIRSARVEYGNIVSSTDTNGKVEPVKNFQAHASEPGSVQAVYVKAGEQVAAGALLLRMNAATAEARVETARSAIAQAQAAQFDLRNGGSADERIAITGDLDRAKLQVAQAQQSLTALKALQAQGAASANEVAAAQERLQTAESSAASLQQRSTSRYAPTDRQRVQAQLADSRANLSAAEQTLSLNVVRAPFAGTVYSLPVKAYDFVSTGDALVQLADLTHMQVFAYFDEPEIGKLRVNDPVTIHWEAKPKSIWHGHIIRTPTTVTTYGTRNVGECLIMVDDASGDLLPYTNVTVSVTTQQIFHVLLIPREGLRTQGGDQNYVFVVKNGELVKRPVTVGGLNLMSVQITAGLSAGDEIALAPLSSSVDLTEGMRVKVVR